MKKLSIILLLFVMPVLIIINTSQQVEAFSVEHVGDYVYFKYWYRENPLPNNSAWYNAETGELGAYAKQFIATEGYYDADQFNGYLGQAANSIVTYNVSIDNQDDMLYINMNHHGDLSVENGWGADEVGATTNLTLHVTSGSVPLFTLESDVELWSGHFDWIDSSFKIGAGYDVWHEYEVYYDGGEFDNSYWVGLALDPGDYQFNLYLNAYAEVEGTRLELSQEEASATSDCGNTASFDLRDELPMGASLVTEMDLTSPVPIPSAIWLLGSGLIGIVGFRKKPRKEV